MRLRTIVTALLAAGAFGLAGCGGDNGNGADTGEAETPPTVPAPIDTQRGETDTVPATETGETETGGGDDNGGDGESESGGPGQG